MTYLFQFSGSCFVKMTPLYIQLETFIYLFFLNKFYFLSFQLGLLSLNK